MPGTEQTFQLDIDFGIVVSSSSKQNSEEAEIRLEPAAKPRLRHHRGTLLRRSLRPAIWLAIFSITSFAKSVGGCPSNIAIGTARLGLKSAVITRVGDEQKGRYVREQMVREGVATDGITTDPQRLTSLVLLSVENDKTFPLIFDRDNCADSALCEADIDGKFVASSAVLLVTGTHFARPLNNAAQRKAMKIAKAHGRKICFDIDYRPDLWASPAMVPVKSATSSPITFPSISRPFSLTVT